MKMFRKTFAALVIMVLVLCMGSVAFAKDHPDRVVDDAGLLTEREISSLMSRLDEISEKYDIDVAVVTVESFSQSSAMAAADDYFDYNHYGLGSDEAGVMLFISTSGRDWWITTKGQAINIFSDSDIESIGDNVTDYMRDDNYAAAFNKFADLCEDEIVDAFTYHWGRYLVISIIIGLIVGGIYILVLMSKLKTVAPNNRAANYVVPGSLNVTHGHEMFLYQTLDVTARPTESSSTHTSSSGSTHGGGGGKY